MQPTTAPSPQSLLRVVGVPGAVLMGLGSILGTGVFVSIGIAAGSAGPRIILATLLAAGVATFNGLSSAQLAASHPVSGGTYAYGYRYLHPALGFSAGWMFLCAKSASAATAALGFAGYILSAAGDDTGGWQVPTALVGVFVLTAVVMGGARRSSRANAAIVCITLLALAIFVVAGMPIVLRQGMVSFADAPSTAGWPGFLEATALMFVAYTGYGRIATLGEEIREPARNIPRAIILTLALSMIIYVAVSTVAVGMVGAPRLFGITKESAAPLQAIFHTFDMPLPALVVSVGAITAMLGVLLNLLLGLSRVVLAMARNGDLPERLGRVEGVHPSPRAAVLLVGCIIGGLVLAGSVQLTWSFSAFTVLVYYAITNLAALRLPAASRLYPRSVSFLGLVCCLGLAFWVDPAVWGGGLVMLALGLAWHGWRRRTAQS